MEGWILYSELDDSIIKTAYFDFDEVLRKRAELATRNQMPREEWKDAIERWKIVKCIITYSLPTKK